MSLDHFIVFYLTDIHYMVPYRAPKKNVLSCIIARIRGHVYKVLGINSATLLHLYGYDAESKILIFLKNFQELVCYHSSSSHKSFSSNNSVHNFRAQWTLYNTIYSNGGISWEVSEYVRFVRTFVFILASTAKVISEHRPTNVVSQPGIEPGTLRFQDKHEAHCATEATSASKRSAIVEQTPVKQWYTFLYRYS